MQPAELLQRLGEDQKFEEVIDHGWQESQSSMPASLPVFLQREQIRESCVWGALDSDEVAQIIGVAERIADTPALFQLFWHCYRLWFEDNEYRRFAEWPLLEKSLGDESGVFYLLVILDAARHAVESHHQRKLPEEVTRETCSDIRIARDRYRSITGGRLGAELRLMGWFRIHAWGLLFRLGRLQYIANSFSGKIKVYKHLQTGATLALNQGGVQFTGEGYVDGALGKFDEKDGWTSRWSEDSEQITASPASPLGMAVRQEVTLKKQDWELRLQPGDQVLAIHIPEGKDMTVEDCGESMRRANEFFPQYFPERPFKALVSSSWIFNTQLEEILGPQSNLVGYMRELYLYPIRSNGKAGFYFVWYTDEVDPVTAPRDTRLRRAYLDYLERGIPIRNGSMFFLPEHLDKFGTQHYRNQRSP
ncbi:MAG: acyltransferase domain-containing protein [Planctomycetota bacterium]|nr:acyltransferase domain-containing protein [Planctomycetota bacterium]MDA1138484.1 acyltransferase domain-containing protein [Planctomycetota bacterium]